jgi:large subunit ribosomal protein L17
MRHRNAGRQFSRNTSHRKAMFRALTANLVAHERIETTDAKAKELKRVAERLITHAVRLGDVAYTPQDQLSPADKAKRQAAQQHMSRFLRRFGTVKLDDKETKIDLVEKVFLDLARRFKGRPGGYTRIIKLGNRRGDNAPMSLVEFVVEGGEPYRPGSKPKAPKAPKPAKGER